jgi:hypothetical protein
VGLRIGEIGLQCTASLQQCGAPSDETKIQYGSGVGTAGIDRSISCAAAVFFAVTQSSSCGSKLCRTEVAPSEVDERSGGWNRKPGLDSGHSIDRCWMDVKNRRNLPDCLPLLCGGGSAFLMTCLRTAAHEETELLTVLYFPFRVRTYWQKIAHRKRGETFPPGTPNKATAAAKSS